MQTKSRFFVTQVSRVETSHFSFTVASESNDVEVSHFTTLDNPNFSVQGYLYLVLD